MGSKLTRYSDLLTDIKTCIRQAQTRAVMLASAEMIIMYWDIGRMVEERQHLEGWGAAVIPRLSRDIHNDLPEIKGFSERNLKRMIRFYREYPSLVEKVPQAAAQLPEQAANEKGSMEAWPQIEFTDDREGCLFTVIVHRKEVDRSVKTRSSPKSSPKTEDKIVERIRQDVFITTEKLGENLGISKRAILKQIEKLKKQGHLRRIGPARGGHWEVVE